jgi:hypothetical protein
MLPLFLTGAVLMGCEDKTAKSPESEAKTADAKTDADKREADVKAKADKTAADVKADAAKTAANAKADAAKAAADAKTAADKSAAEASRDQASKLLSDLKTAVKDEKWTDSQAIIKRLDDLRDKLTADQQASYDSLKKQYDDKH